MDPQRTPRLEYTRLRGEKDPSQTAPGIPNPPSKTNEALTWTVLAICLAGWAVIGLILWLPRLLAAVLAFSVALMQSTMTETSAESAGRRLRSAANFYRRGFVGAVESIKSREREDEASDDDSRVESRMIVRETAWALVVWYLILGSAGIVRPTPADVVTTLAHAPWAEMSASFLDTMTSIPDLVRR